MTGGSLDVVVDVDGLPSFFFNTPLTKEHFDMADDAFEELIGNGDAKVSVSMNMKDSSFGSGFGAHVTVTLSCNQDAETLTEAHDLATELAKEFLDESFHKAHELLVENNEEKRDAAQAEKEKAAQRKAPAKQSRGRGRRR